MYNVVLLKSSDTQQLSEGPTKDRYVEFITSKTEISNYIDQVRSINLLKFESCNLDVIHARLCGVFVHNELPKDHKCLIVTSRQTVESIDKAFSQELTSNQAELDLDELANCSEIDRKFIIYCVGQATLSALNTLLARFKSVNKSLEKCLLVKSMSDGKQNAVELARLIVQDHAVLNSTHYENYAFYPCSSIRKDDLSSELIKANVSYQEITAYRTAHSEQGLSELVDFLDNHTQACLLVFFSPSGADAVFGSDTLVRIITSRGHLIHFISIGPSTTKKLKELVSHSPVLQLDEPSPQALFNQILKLIDQ